MAILFTTDGVSQLSIDSNENSLPQSMELSSNHPNPFNPTTTIEFKINYHSNIDLFITYIVYKVLWWFVKGFFIYEKYENE